MNQSGHEPTRRAEVCVHAKDAGVLEVQGERWRFRYAPDYDGPPVSLTLPVRPEPYELNRVPSFFDGLLPEGAQLQALLRARKLDRADLFGQLVEVGSDLVGAVTIRGLP